MNNFFIGSCVVILILMLNSFRHANNKQKTDTLQCVAGIALMCGILILIGIPWQLVTVLFDFSAGCTTLVIVYAEELEDDERL